MTLEERAAEAAAKAVCTRCKELILGEGFLPLGMVHGTFRVPAARCSRSFRLCGNCAPEFHRFLAGAEVLR